MKGFFTSNKDLDSTILVVAYVIALWAHIGLAASVVTYGNSEASKFVSEWLGNIGFLIFGAFFRKGDPNGNTTKQGEQ